MHQMMGNSIFLNEVGEVSGRFMMCLNKGSHREVSMRKFLIKKPRFKGGGGSRSTKTPAVPKDDIKARHFKWDDLGIKNKDN